MKLKENRKASTPLAFFYTHPKPVRPVSSLEVPHGT
jgi:hypothetical protein